MKKKALALLFILTASLCLVACGREAQRFESIRSEEYKDGDGNILDGEYPAKFSLDEITEEDGLYTISFEVYGYDQYEPSILGVKAGDTIVVDHKDVLVESASTSRSGKVLSGVVINGGIEEGGYFIVPENESAFRTSTLDDYPIYFDLGNISCAVSKDCVFEDFGCFEFLEETPNTGDFSDLLADLEEGKNPSLTCTNCILTVENGEITKVLRNWNP